MSQIRPMIVYKIVNRLNRSVWWISYWKLLLFIVSNKLTINRKQIEFHIRIHNVGMFASFNWLLYIAILCEKHAIQNFSVIFPDFIYGLDSKGVNNNWLSGIVEMRKNKSDISLTKKKILISNLKSLPGIRTNVADLNLEEANRVFFDNYHFTGSTNSAVERMIADNDLNKFIAIHFRGTDKVKEAYTVQLEDYLTELKKLMSKGSEKFETIFLASDDGVALAELEFRIMCEWPNLQVVYQKDIHRSYDGKPVHLRKDLENVSARSMAFEALLDALILSRSSILIRNSSFLSSWASVFNPSLEVILLNEPFENKRWFPESAILKKNY